VNGKEFWATIEAAQGFAFVSDAICDANEDTVKREATYRLPYAIQVVKILLRVQGKKHKICPHCKGTGIYKPKAKAGAKSVQLQCTPTRAEDCPKNKLCGKSK